MDIFFYEESRKQCAGQTYRANHLEYQRRIKCRNRKRGRLQKLEGHFRKFDAKTMKTHG